MEEVCYGPDFLLKYLIAHVCLSFEGADSCRRCFTCSWASLSKITSSVRFPRVSSSWSCWRTFCSSCECALCSSRRRRILSSSADSNDARMCSSVMVPELVVDGAALVLDAIGCTTKRNVFSVLA